MLFMNKFHKIWDASFRNLSLRVFIHFLFWAFYMGFLLKNSFTLHFSLEQDIGVLILGIVFVLFLFYPLVYGIVPLFKKNKFFKGGVAFVIYYFIAVFLRFYYITLLTQYQEQWHYSFDQFLSFYYQEILSGRIISDVIPNIIVFLYILVIPIIIKFLRYSYGFSRELNEKNQEKTKMELDFLKGQLNPHLFFNTLNNLQSFILHGEKNQAIQVIESLSEFMRYSLYETQNEFIEIDKELKLIQDYIEIEKIRHEDSVSISYSFNNENSLFKLPPLLIMPLIENAFKHSSGLNFDEVFIKINGSINDEFLQINVSNFFNKPSNTVNLEGSKGIGLQTLEKRLEYYYPSSYMLHSEVVDNLYVIHLRIDIKEK